MNRNRVTSIALLIVLFASLTVAHAQAGGTRYSSMYGVWTGFNVRNFDEPPDDYVTTWAELYGCYLSGGGNPSPIGLSLWRVNSWWPDDNLGYGYYYPGGYQSWGDKSPGTYHFTLSSYTGSYWSQLDCPTVNYGW